MSIPPLAQIPVGVVVERRKSTNKWIDFTWRPISILPGHAAAAAWTELWSSGEVTTYFAGSSTIDLYRSDTPNYRYNLESGRPCVWVKLRPTGGEPPYCLVAVTADPTEGESFTEAGNDLVEALPMPEPVRAVVQAFVAENLVERPFYKRKRDRADREALSRRAPVRQDQDDD